MQKVIAGMKVEQLGQGSPVVLVHGLGGTGSVWAPQIHSLVQQHTLYIPDLKGSGRSQLSDYSLSVQSIVQDLLSLLDAEGIEKASFAGHSLGSLIVQHLAASHPNRVDKLILVGAVKAPNEAGSTATKARAALVREQGMEAVVETILKAALAPSTHESQPVSVAFVKELLLRQNPLGYAATCEVLAAAIEPDYTKIRAKTLIVNGENDAVGAPAVVDYLASNISGTTVEMLPNCGHWTTIEQAEKVTQLIHTFLR